MCFIYPIGPIGSTGNDPDAYRMGGGRDGGLQIVSDKIFYPTLERRPSCVCVRFSQGMITLIMKSTKTTTCNYLV